MAKLNKKQFIEDYNRVKKLEGKTYNSLAGVKIAVNHKIKNFEVKLEETSVGGLNVVRVSDNRYLYAVLIEEKDNTFYVYSVMQY